MSTVDDILDFPDGVYPLPRLNTNNGVIRTLLTQNSADAQLFATSTTSRTIGTGTFTFTLTVPRSFLTGLPWVVITYQTDQNKYMVGKVTSNIGSIVTIEVELASGSGTYANWIIAPSAKPLGATTGTGAGQINTNGAALVASRTVETDTAGQFITAPKNTAYNKNFGTGSGDVASGNHTHTGVVNGTGSMNAIGIGGNVSGGATQNVHLTMSSQSSTGTERPMGSLRYSWGDTTDASRWALVQFYMSNAMGDYEYLRAYAIGSSMTVFMYGDWSVQGSLGFVNEKQLTFYRTDGGPVGMKMNANNRLQISTGYNNSSGMGIDLVCDGTSGDIRFYRNGTLLGVLLGTGVLELKNTTAPTALTLGDGGLWVEGGALKYRGSSGTVTTIAPA